MFLIVGVTAEPSADDVDGDGLSNFEEAEYGTDPTDIDSDGDGFTDDTEVELGTDPNDKDSHFESLMSTGFATQDLPVKNFLLGILVATILAEGVVLVYFKSRGKEQIF